MSSKNFHLDVIHEIEDEYDDNVDVVVKLTDGRQFVATVFTLQNLSTLFKKNRNTGECAGGTYLWASDMILVNRLTPQVLEETVATLIRDDEFETAFTEIHPESL